MAIFGNMLSVVLEAEAEEDKPTDYSENASEKNNDDETNDTSDENEPEEDKPTDYSDNTEDNQENGDIDGDDNTTEEEPTDYADNTEDTTEDNTDSEPIDNEGTEDTSTDTVEVAEKTDVEKNALIMNDYQNLYYYIKNTLEKISTVDKGNLLTNTIISQVIKNITLLQNKLYNYIVNNFSKNYINNLYQYNFFIQALKINIEMLKKIKDFDVN